MTLIENIWLMKIDTKTEMNITFVQIISSDFQKTVCSLIEEEWRKKNKIILVVENKLSLQQMDDTLWRFKRRAFIPHATENDPLASYQPIYITTKTENNNNANILFSFLLDEIELFKQVEKTIILFNKERINKARELYNQFKKSGQILEYKKIDNS